MSLCTIKIQYHLFTQPVYMTYHCTHILSDTVIKTKMHNVDLDSWLYTDHIYHIRSFDIFLPFNMNLFFVSKGLITLLKFMLWLSSLWWCFQGWKSCISEEFIHLITFFLQAHHKLLPCWNTLSSNKFLCLTIHCLLMLQLTDMKFEPVLEYHNYKRHIWQCSYNLEENILLPKKQVWFVGNSICYALLLNGLSYCIKAWLLIYRWYPAKRAISAMPKHGG